MSIGIRCQSCTREYHVNSALAGKRVKCKACGAAIRVPATTLPQEALIDSIAAPVAPVSNALPVAPASSLRPKKPSNSKPASAEPNAPKLTRAKAASASSSVSIADAIAAESQARATSPDPQAAEESTPKPSPPGGPLRRVYQAIAVVVVLGFLGLVYLLGREAGIWGELQVRRSQVAKVLNPMEKLARDRYISKANLVRLGLALDLWAKNHRGMYPMKLESVNEVAELTPDVFHSPFVSEQTPSPFRDNSYVYLYVRSMGVAIHDQTVLAYDAAELASGEGANVLYGSGEVKWVQSADIAGEIAQSEAQRLGIAVGAEADGDKLAARSIDRVKPGKRRRE